MVGKNFNSSPLPESAEILDILNRIEFEGLFFSHDKLAERQVRKKLPYILSYKSRNFGQNSDKILSIRLIRRGSNIWSFKMSFIHYLHVSWQYKWLDQLFKNINLIQIFGLIFSIRLIRESTYMRVYTVFIKNIFCWCARFGNLYFLNFQNNQVWVQESILAWL